MSCPHLLRRHAASGFGRRDDRTAMALVVTLSMIVLITVVTLAFYSYATSNRQIENSWTNQMKVEQLARSAGDYIAQGFIQEIRSTSHSVVSTTGSAAIYTPVSVAFSVPLRTVSSTIIATDANFFNLIRQSLPAADVNATTHNSGTASQNGRVISATRWNTPALLSGPGFTANGQLPCWINISRTTGPTSTVTTSVIGRFAYNIYNIGGLLDVNAAGHPSTITATDSVGTVAGADLKTLGVSQTAVNTLINSFRNPGAGLYTNRVEALSQNGFMRSVVTNSLGAVYTNSFFLNRQDLLRYTKTQNTELAPALPYLTVFSRTVNAPSWGPTKDIGSFNYKSNANKNSSVNRFLPNVRFQGPATTTVTHYDDKGNASTYLAKVGEPLVQRRFSLGKLAWLTHTGNRPDITDAAIKACFGLKWNGGAYRWDYIGDGSAVETKIKTLDEVAAANREPNFFELLQAGILTGSLGKSGCDPARGAADDKHGSSMGGIYGDETNKAYQVIRIGANIIDQYDSDSYPTAIEFNSMQFWGIEDLPYLYTVVPLSWWGNYPLKTLPIKNYLGFTLWNPHQKAITTATPSNFRIRVNDDAGFNMKYLATTGNEIVFNRSPSFPHGNLLPWIPINGAGSPVFNQVITFTADAGSSNDQQSYREPHLIRTGVGANSNVGNEIDGKITAMLLCEGGSLYPVTEDGNPNRMKMAYYFTKTVFILEYQETPGGPYKPYSTFLGHEEAGGVSGLGGTSNNSVGMSVLNLLGANVAGVGKPDPRSFRFDASWWYYGDKSMRIGAARRTVVDAYLPFFTAGVGPGFHPTYLASNKQGMGAVFATYDDLDGVTRPGDCYFGDQNPYEPTVQTARPVILNRPFQSVAELGYVFRDMPFKTLDFFSDSSGDAGLLDIFSISDEPAIGAGKVNLNTPHSVVLQSLLGTASSPSAVAGAYQSYAMNADKSPTASFPQTVAQLAPFLFQMNTAGSANNTKINLEIPVRALSSSTQTRTWNLLIDIVAQVGRYLNGGSTGADFIVEGERRYWLSIAIDRYTGEIVDQQLEMVNE